MEFITALDAFVSRLVGPWGAVFLLVIALYMVWRLFREAQRDLKASDARVDSLTQAVKDLTVEVRLGKATVRR